MDLWINQQTNQQGFVCILDNLNTSVFNLFAFKCGRKEVFNSFSSINKLPGLPAYQNKMVQIYFNTSFHADSELNFMKLCTICLKIYKKMTFEIEGNGPTDRPTDGPTDRPTDRHSVL